MSNYFGVDARNDGFGYTTKYGKGDLNSYWKNAFERQGSLNEYGDKQYLRPYKLGSEAINYDANALRDQHSAFKEQNDIRNLIGQLNTTQGNALGHQNLNRNGGQQRVLGVGNLSKYTNDSWQPNQYGTFGLQSQAQVPTQSLQINDPASLQRQQEKATTYGLPGQNLQQYGAPSAEQSPAAAPRNFGIYNNDANMDSIMFQQKQQDARQQALAYAPNQGQASVRGQWDGNHMYNPNDGVMRMPEQRIADETQRFSAPTMLSRGIVLENSGHPANAGQQGIYNRYNEDWYARNSQDLEDRDYRNQQRNAEALGYSPTDFNSYLNQSNPLFRWGAR